MNSAIKKATIIVEDNISAFKELEFASEKPVREVAFISSVINGGMTNNKATKLTLVIQLEDGRKLSITQEKDKALLIDF